ncbi:glutathione S-transferase family protein [Plastoroseomonas arctica]|uniref:Glutathione S-transferase family protein n=1 Tax=Plastoroseomonas arctica TaxID=1509237 RepID=A0AAF1JYQ9_9PROT|nr:glutathione S-transferase family protein [Plastoroseomonas arctica]
MFTIYGVYRSRASRNIWLAEEMGVPWRHVPVIQHYRLGDWAADGAPLNTRSAEFLALNPRGQVPALDDDGLVLCESLAINLHLAKRHGGALGPADVAEDGLMTMWSLWAATGVEPHAIEVLYNLVAKPPGERDAGLAERSIAALDAPFTVLESALEGRGYLVGGRFTVADINVAEIVRYAAPAKSLFENRPAIAAWLEQCHARPAFQRMWTTRDAEPA